MTGSGKTGLASSCLKKPLCRASRLFSLTPRGDLTNHLLHFPDLQADDFAPWIDEDAANAMDRPCKKAATAAASNWAKGLERSGIDKARMEKLSTNVDYVVYSPGSTSAFPISILSSLRAPKLDWKKTKKCCARTSAARLPPCFGLVA